MQSFLKHLFQGSVEGVKRFQFGTSRAVKQSKLSSEPVWLVKVRKRWLETEVESMNAKSRTLADMKTVVEFKRTAPETIIASAVRKIPSIIGNNSGHTEGVVIACVCGRDLLSKSARTQDEVMKGSKMTDAYLPNWDSGRVTSASVLVCTCSFRPNSVESFCSCRTRNYWDAEKGPASDFCFPFPDHAERAGQPTSIVIIILCDHVTKRLQGLFNSLHVVYRSVAACRASSSSGCTCA